MNAIRVIFDGKSFIPQQPVSIPADSEAMVIVDQVDVSAQARLDAEIRAYYENEPAGDTDDAAWAHIVSPQSNRAWDED